MSNGAKPRVALVAEDSPRRQELAAVLAADFEVVEAEGYGGAQKALHEQTPDILLLELKAGARAAEECVGLLREIRQNDLDTLAVVLSDDRRKSTALRVMDAGAYDYFLNPVDEDVLRSLLGRAVEKLQTDRENRILREELHRKNAIGDLVGSTEVMRSLFESIRRVAGSSSTVVIRGESGTGKELVARAIHNLSPRRDRPFVGVNCAALPETLMEAELFGYERGAFTGATATKEGRIELAHRGTLFLDEIGTLTTALQSKLLRVLEERTLVRLGGKRAIKVDFRLLTATNEDLEALVRQNRFREDLYYRIHVVPLYVPPLRERADDVPLLVEYFIKVYCAANQLPPKRISDDALSALKRYAWPGNVRELENVVQRIVLMTDGDLVALKNVPRDIAHASRGPNHFRLPSTGIHLVEEVNNFERQWIEAALSQAEGVKAQAARLLGLGKDQMKYLCRKHKL
jgi:DNA-binding NtrC family response regulator